MENSAAVNQRLWEEQQRADGAQRDIEHIEWRKKFVLLFALIVLTLAVATVLANWGIDGTVRL
jgi:hypothetical protein